MEHHNIRALRIWYVMVIAKDWCEVSFYRWDIHAWLSFSTIWLEDDSITALLAPISKGQWLVMLPPHIAEHSPRDLESGCVDSVLALTRRMFGIRAECKRRCVWCRFLCSASKDARVPTQGNMSDPTTHCKPLSHLWVSNPNSSRVVKLQVNYSRCRIGAVN
jgi:hypothetical protein